MSNQDISTQDGSIKDKASNSLSTSNTLSSDSQAASSPKVAKLLTPSHLLFETLSKGEPDSTVKKAKACGKINHLKTNFLGVELDNPLMTASGCFAFGLEMMDYFDPNELGAVVLKGLTLEPRDGNVVPRIAETPAGILNSVGLENPGIDAFEAKYLDEILSFVKVPLVANINGKTLEEYIELTLRLNELDAIKLYELNISCPNVKDGGMAFGANPDMTRLVTREIKRVATKPVIVKLSPNVTNIVMMAKIVEEEGADGIAMINTLLGMAINIKTRKAILGNTYGGLSGPAVKPVALRMIHQVSQQVSLPILGMGGISTWEDAVEFFLAGASAISIGTALFPNPHAVVEIKQGLQQYCEDQKINNIAELVGWAHSDDGKAYRERLVKQEQKRLELLGQARNIDENKQSAIDPSKFSCCL